MIRVFIVDDSPAAKPQLCRIISSDPELRVVGIAANGEEALTAIPNAAPQVIIVAASRRRKGGLETTRQIARQYPIPIIILTSDRNPAEAATAFEALQAGAVMMLDEPRRRSGPAKFGAVQRLLQTIKLMSEVKVVRRFDHRSEAPGRKMEAPSPRSTPVKIEPLLIAIGASTGGPHALQSLLSLLPAHFPLPILIVQHIPPGFLERFAESLRQTTNLQICIATPELHLAPGTVYLAPNDYQMGVKPGGLLHLSKDPPENDMRPSVSYLFRSIARHYQYRAVGILLTGMGKDGADELKSLRERGAVTVVQDQASSIVYGMPGEAVRLHAALHVLPPDRIARLLMQIAEAPITGECPQLVTTPRGESHGA